MRSVFGRRAFLGGVGLTATTLAAPFLRTLTSKASAQAAPPKRFIATFSGNGTIASAWQPTGTETSFTLGPILRPFDPYKAKLLVLWGIDSQIAITFTDPGSNHLRGTGGFLTGERLNAGPFFENSGWANGISLDQVIAHDVGDTTRFASLVLGVQIDGSRNSHRISYSAPNAPLPPVDDPYRVFDDLFADLSLPATEIDRRRRRRQSILDHALGDLGRIRTELGAGDRPALDSHLESIRDIERRLALDGAPTGCTAPTRPARIDLGDAANYGRIGDLMTDILVAALRCDLTRVATLLWSGGASRRTFPELGISDSFHDDLSHASDTNTVARDKLIRIHTFYAERIARLVGALDAVPEGGGTMLDNTVVLWGNELGKGNNHDRREVPYLLAGGCGGALRQGRYLQYAGVPHNNLLVSLGNAMGLTLTRFGHPDVCTGRVDNVLA